MSKTKKNIFIIICFVMCMIPSVCMLFAGSEETIGNEKTVPAPSLTNDDGSLNTNILSDAGNYFEHHYAFRPQLITADAKVQSGIFNVSNTDTVVTGTDGWLYYSSTLNDYLGADTLTEHGMWNLAHNISLLQNYAEEQGAKFLFSVPPNKNSLYGENMPYYYGIAVSDEHNRDSLSDALEKQGVRYSDLFGLFESGTETLYLKEDSHWNNRGAALASDALLSAVGKNHDSFFESPASRTKSHDGDLRAMIYPAEKQPEYDYTYETGQSYEYIANARTLGEEVSAEDFLVLSENPDASGRLLMYRDSFANTLIPFLSGEFSFCAYSKAVPGNMAADIKEYRPDYVMIEKAERNIRDFVTAPCLIPAPEAEITEIQDNMREVVPLSFASEPCLADTSYIAVSGTLRDEDAGTGTRIFLEVETEGGRRLYEAFNTLADGNNNGFLLYLDRSLPADPEDGYLEQQEVKLYASNG